MINFNQLVVFRAVAEAGGFTRAMEVLQVSQSAASQQIIELERFLGTTLFDRLPRGVRLTTAGETLLRYARRMAILNDEAERAVREGREGEGGRLAVGVSAAIGSYLLPAVLGKLRRAHPAVELEVATGRLEELKRRLLDRTLDLVLTEETPPEDDELSHREFGEDRLVAIVHPGHPLAVIAPGKHKAPAVTARRLCAEVMILADPGSRARCIVDRALSVVGAQALNVALTLGSAEAIKGAVAAGLGVAVVRRMSVARELEAGVLVEVPLRDMKAVAVPLYEVSLRNRQPGAMVQAFVRLLSRN